MNQLMKYLLSLQEELWRQIDDPGIRGISLVFISLMVYGFVDWIFDARVFTKDTKHRIPGSRSNLWDTNLISVMKKARSEKNASWAMMSAISKFGDGNVCATNIFGLKFVIVAHPDMAKSICTGKHTSFPKAPRYSRFKFALGDGLVTSEGEVWRSHRSLLNPGFHAEALRLMVDVFNDKSNELLRHWDKIYASELKSEYASVIDREKNIMRVNMNQYMTSLTLAIITSAGFSYNLDFEGINDYLFSKDLNVVLNEMNTRITERFSFSYMFYFQRQKRVREAVSRFWNLIDDMIETRLKYRASKEGGGKQRSSIMNKQQVKGDHIADNDSCGDTGNNNEENNKTRGSIPRNFSEDSENVSETWRSSASPMPSPVSPKGVGGEDGDGDEDETSSPSKDLLDMLLNLSEPSSNNPPIFSKVTLRDHMLTFIGAGHETTSTALMWTMYELSRHPDVQEKCHEEIDSILGSCDAEHVISYDMINKFVYLSQVLKETLRLHPPVPILARQNKEDCSVGPYNLSKNHLLVICVLALHRHPDYWTDPQEFLPERWAPSTPDSRFLKEAHKHPFQYMPFSAGPRNCIGQRFAHMEMVVLLAQLLSKYSVSVSKADEEILKFEETVVSQPVNFHCQFQKRVKK